MNVPPCKFEVREIMGRDAKVAFFVNQPVGDAEKYVRKWWPDGVEQIAHRVFRAYDRNNKEFAYFVEIRNYGTEEDIGCVANFCVRVVCSFLRDHDVRICRGVESLIAFEVSSLVSTFSVGVNNPEHRSTPKKKATKKK